MRVMARKEPHNIAIKKIAGKRRLTQRISQATNDTSDQLITTQDVWCSGPDLSCSKVIIVGLGH